MEEGIPDFVIKRKRKRYQPAIDLCLGFYAQSTPHTGTPISPYDFHHCGHSFDLQHGAGPAGHPSRTKSMNDSSSAEPNSLPFVLDPTSPGDSNPKLNNIVTVHEFLRRTPPKPTKLYVRRKKCHRVNLDQPQPCEPRPPSGRNGVSNPDGPSKRKGKRRRITKTRHYSGSPPSSGHCITPRRHRRPRRTLANRLLGAAIMSNAEPGPIIFPGEPLSSSRRPLRFVADDWCLQPSSIAGRKPRTLTLVDPRKSVPFCEAAFSPQRPAFVEPANSKPLTEWRPRPENSGRRAAHKAVKKRMTRTKESPRCGCNCLPLRFIPLHDAEKMYQARLISLQQGG